MTLSTKAGLVFFAVALVAGFVMGTFGMRHYRTAMLVTLGVLCFVSVFVLAYREQVARRSGAPGRGQGKNSSD